MPFLDDFDLVLFQREMEDRDGVFLVVHELRGNSPAGEIRKLLGAAGQILFRLDYGEPIASSFGLNRDNKLLTVLVDTYSSLRCRKE